MIFLTSAVKLLGHFLEAAAIAFVKSFRGGVELADELCCGSAGTYSVLNPDLAYQLRDRKLGHLVALQPKVIVSANIGCITHLQSGTDTPVRHWIEILGDAVKK